MILGAISLTLGKFPISYNDIYEIMSVRFLGKSYAINPAMETVLFDVRLPRILSAIIIGGSLSVSGAAYQGIFNNPLVSPDILGATAGASLGAAIGIIFSWSIIGIQINSFITGILAVAVTWFVSTKVRQNNQVLVLVLSGMLVGTIFTRI